MLFFEGLNKLIRFPQKAIMTFGILLSFGIVLAVGSVHDYFKERMCRIKSFKSK